MRTDELIGMLRRPGSALLCGRRSWTDDADLVLLREPEQTVCADEAGRLPELLEIVARWQGAGCHVIACVSYEAGAAFDLPTHPPRVEAPLAWFGAYVAGNVARLDARALPHSDDPPRLRDAQVHLGVGEAGYHAAIARIKQLIAAGDTYQVNYTCRASFEAELDPAAYFLAMQRSHPVPYAAFVNTGDAQVLSLSPELFLQRRGQLLTSRPMKGTRARGRTIEEDAALAADLVSAAKDRAENLMIVDMVRNDLGRICEIGSVHVPRLFEAEKYRSVWQMTSTVTGELRGDVSLPEVFAATFPGASITGAPKRRTMEIIRELEPDPRGVYCGAVGLLLPGGDFTLNLPIRTLVHRDGRFRLGIGAGIVADSDPQSEYDETLLKSHFAFRLEPDLRLFETLLLDDAGELTHLDAHLDRLARSAEYWGFECDLGSARRELERCTRDTTGPSVVRLELSADGALAIQLRSAPAPADHPLRVALSAQRTDAGDRLLQHKTTARGLYDDERDRLLRRGFDEVIFANTGERLTEGAITSIFLRFEQRWVTPPTTDGLLPGIWRESFRRETGAEERAIPLRDLRGADAIVVGNSVRGMMPVGEVVDAGSGETLWRQPQ